MTLDAGARLGPYEILAPLGAGGMGEVYRARDCKLGRDIALKVLPPAFAEDRDRMARFEREAQVLASLNHQNIAAIHGVEESEGLRALVMELVEGPTLAERIAAGRLAVEEALSIARQIADALEAAHERGIVHRDLKPANVKLAPDGQVKLLDFGLAKALTDDAPASDAAHSPTLSLAMTQAGVILGTAAYMSPEQARGAAVDRRSDVWSFGVVLFEMLAGRQLFRGPTASDTLAGVLKGEMDWSALPPDTPPSIDRLLRRCLERDPKRRLRDFGDVRLEIESAFVEETPATKAQPLSTRPARFAALIALAALAGAAAAALATLALVERARPGAPVRLVVTLPADGTFPVDENALAVSPNGRRLAFCFRGKGGRQIYVRAIDEFEAKPVPGTEDAANPFFSADSQWIGFSARGKLRKVPAVGGPVTVICSSQGAWGATWSDDGTIYFAERFQGETLWRVPSSGGTPEVVSRPDPKRGESCHRWPHALPASQGVLVTVGTETSFDDARIALLDPKSGELRTLIEGGTSPRYLPSGHLVFARAGTLLAVGFDPGRKQVTGAPLPLLEGVITSSVSGDAQYGVAADGSLVYVPGVSKDRERLLLRVDRNGVIRPLTELRRAFEDLSLSPDGRRVALTIEGPAWNVWLYDIARMTLSRFTHERVNTDPVWTPDGKRVVYTSFRDGQYGLYWKSGDGSGTEERLVASPNFLHAYSFSADGRLLCYTESHPDTNYDVWLLPVAGERRPQLVLNTPAREVAPVLSPDGRWLAYESNESGGDEIYLRSYPGLGAKTQVSPNGGYTPIWSKTGRELFYLGGGKIMVVAVETKPELSVGTARALCDLPRSVATGRPYDPAPDGSFVYIAAAEQPRPTAIHVVLNWAEEVRARLAAPR